MGSSTALNEPPVMLNFVAVRVAKRRTTMMHACDSSLQGGLARCNKIACTLWYTAKDLPFCASRDGVACA
jgi:hypothetical protein